MATFEYVVDLTWTGVGAPGVNVWHFRADTPTGADVQACVDVIESFYTDVVLAGVLIDGYQMIGQSQAVDVSTREISPVTPFTVANASGGFSYAAPLMMCLTLATTQATRSGRGRKFIGPVNIGIMDTQGTPSAGALTGLRLAGTNLVSASEGLTLGAIGVYSQEQGLFRDLVQTRVRDTFAVLRSRRD